MKILVVHNRYRAAAPSGENRVVDQESAALAARGHAVEHFERSSDDIGRLPVWRTALLPATAVWSEEARRSLVGVLRTWRPDIVHLHNTFPLISASALWACRAEGVPAVATVHNYRLLCASHDLFRQGRPCRDCVGRSLPLPALVHGCYRGSAAWTLPVAADMVAQRTAWRRAVSAYIFVSEAQRRVHGALDLPPERVFVKWNLVPRRPAPSGVGGRDDLVVYLGRLDAAKGVPVLMAAWDRVRAETPTSRLRLVVAGGGPLGPAVADWAAARPSVEAPGILDPARCAELLGRARAVIVPSVWEETFGLVVVEAKAAATPAVGSARGSLPELIEHGVDGVVFAPGDVDALAGVLGDVEAHPDRWERYGAAARRSYERRFDPDQNLDQLVGIYRYALEHPVGAPTPTAFVPGAPPAPRRRAASLPEPR